MTGLLVAHKDHEAIQFRRMRLHCVNSLSCCYGRQEQIVTIILIEADAVVSGIKSEYNAPDKLVPSCMFGLDWPGNISLFDTPSLMWKPTQVLCGKRLDI